MADPDFFISQRTDQEIAAFLKGITTCAIALTWRSNLYLFTITKLH